MWGRGGGWFGGGLETRVGMGGRACATRFWFGMGWVGKVLVGAARAVMRLFRAVMGLFGWFMWNLALCLLHWALVVMRERTLGHSEQTAQKESH
jgi:hypothetical protein